MANTTKGSRVGEHIQYFIFRLGLGERITCNCPNHPHMVHGTMQDTSKQPIMIMQEAIRSDDTICATMCEEHAKEHWNVTVDRENDRLKVQRP